MYVLITGGTNGIGLAGARGLAGRGARIGLVARDREKAARVAGELGDADVFQADLTSQASIREMTADVAERAPVIDVLVNNAGAIYGTHQVSAEGIELTWALNVVAPYLITRLLADRLAVGARVIGTASDEHEKAKGIDFDDLGGERFFSGPSRLAGGSLRRYGETKLALILMSAELARRMPAIHTYTFEPGLVATGFNTNNGRLMKLMMAMTKPFARTPEQGAETLLWLATSPDVAEESGYYYSRERRTDPSPAGQDPAAAERLWTTLAEQTALPK
ncbi:SDR family NAD(P)-dependent oxidoreductase [Kribbella speibonae]|uniref:SDR family NAD(P)-dependent oxidoreductase n=1 Tax=Kribbella speibonae TaxID=1572660 RepID=A0A4R0IVP7_9ACTN|nr:SDR family NAD(P)-dependent oxidoreductase [Kribbella speibonae]TCC38031.1 SDR family NAD(P)-dependent oxidoreductase [Kribbella speibonae]